MAERPGTAPHSAFDRRRSVRQDAARGRTSGEHGAYPGPGLTAPASVTFNGTPATVTSVSPSQIVATVPAVATTGSVVVTMGGVALTSNTVFQVRQ